jgi:HK97 family phage major capsid protein
VAEAQALLEDQIYFLGDGSATYGGFNGLANALPSGAYISGVAWGSITTANIQNAMGSVQNVKNGNLAFVCSRQFYFQVLARLDKAASQFKELAGANPSFTAGSIAVGNFLGYPVYISQVLPTATGANKACYFGDFSGISKIGDRRQLSLDVSREYAFNADLITMRATARLAVNVHGDGRASTFGPVVCIQGA